MNFVRLGLRLASTNWGQKPRNHARDVVVLTTTDCFPLMSPVPPLSLRGLL